MDNASEQSGEKAEPSHKFDVWNLYHAIQTYLSDKGVDHLCSVSIKQKGFWIELQGDIDSHRTRSALFSLVPAKRGRQYIIDKLRIVSEPAKKEAWV